MGEGGNRTSMNLGTVSLVLKCVILGLVCICLGVGIGAVGQVGGTVQGTVVQGTAGEWLWAWTVSAFLLPLALMIGARLMDRPIPKELELATLILGALLFLASGSWIIDRISLWPSGITMKEEYTALGAMCIITSMPMVVDAMIVAMTIFKQG